ncbi:substrate-binding domain-containing protein [Streptomyces sp. NPDC052013]|uniref:vWA domain-containing protein n=1 Tax=Streptomyces sp. NPDC052013 TaxID=3365679 RepID=UPI0037CE4157
MNRLDPRGLVNRALLVGVSQYDHTEPPDGVPGDLPAVKHNVLRLQKALGHGQVFGEQDIKVVHSPLQGDFQAALLSAVAETDGLLLFYFAGHGAIPSGGDELFLQMRNARVVAGGPAVFLGADPVSAVLATLASGRAERIVLILDCCFAGNAGRVWEAFEGHDRVLLLASVQANNRIDAGDPHTPTPYTEQLVELLEQGGEIWFGDLTERLRVRMKGRKTLRGEKWEPQDRAKSGEDVLLAASGTAPPPPRRPTLLAVLLRFLRELPGRLGPARLKRRLRDIRWPRRRTMTRSVLPLVLALALIGFGGRALTGFLSGDDPPCAPPPELRVVTDPDLEQTIRAAADTYLTSEANTTGDGCRRSGITVYSAGSSDVVTALRTQSGIWQEPRDEDTNPQRDIGPQPDVWIPASRADVARVEAGQDTDAVAVLSPDDEPLAYSPVVLAVPQNLAAEFKHERTDLPLLDMIDDLTERDDSAEVRRPDPEHSDVGLLATVGLYGEDARAAARGERLVAQPGSPLPTAADLLCTLPDDDAVDNRTAALVPEFLLRSGVGCDHTTRSPRMAQYPEDVPGVEPLFVRVRWLNGDDDRTARDRAADGFRDWLAGAGGRAVFARDGFRSADDGELLDLTDVADGVLRAPSPLDESAGRKAMERALTEYREAGGPGRVLFLLDSSGSMAGLWKGPSGGPGLLRQSLGGLGGEDQYGVWSVAGTGDRTHETLLPLASHRRADAERTVGSGARVRDAEADPGAALLAAFAELERRGDDRRRQLIVHITDGEDNTRLTGGRLERVLDAARETGVPVTVVSLQSGGCDAGRADRQVADASGGRCLDSGDDLGAALHDEVARTGTGEG